MPEEPSEKSDRPRRQSKAKSTPVGKADGKSPNGAHAAAVTENGLDRSLVPIIGIGASAGGLEALGQFFDVMSADSGGAFVVVLHLDPTRESRMAELLAASTKMPVLQVEDGMAIEANHVYVIAPAFTLKIVGGTLRLSEPAESRGHRHPVDELFRSLATERHERAVAIVLSGTGTNGTEGLREIKAQGGMILVQTPHTAKFDGMPRSAIAAELADHILAPQKMPEVVVHYLEHGYVAAPETIEVNAAEGGASIEKVLEVVRAQTGTDFGSYKRSTLGRRVHRRLGLRNITTLDDYIAELRANPEEVDTLARDLMINVTGFFRDPDAWKALADQAIAPLVAERESGASLRIWIPGCSTGEEAYSMAMMVTTQAAAVGKRFDLKIFATDAREENLRKARDGIYPAAATVDIPAEQRRRFFVQLDSSYQVNNELRDMVVFAQQNLLGDPPFSRMDLISCRNLLIYIEPDAQGRIIALCHFALRQGGYLFLGNAETIGRHDELFETVSKKWRVYRRLGPTRHDIVEFPLRRDPVQAGANVPAPSSDPAIPAAEMARRALLDRFAPASVLIDRKFRVLYFHGATGDYLEQPTGEPTKDILAMAREGLSVKLRAAIREATTTGKDATINARVGRGKASDPVRVSVTPIPGSAQGQGVMLVSFTPETSETGSVPAVLLSADTGPSHSEQDLQEELQEARAELQSTVEQMETANEEMKASNEEITSMNEELQSTNEELETSKEELQSFNEELHTVNNQLQHKIKELEDLSDDLNNLLVGTETATLFLDNDLCIKWFSPATKDLFDLVTNDIGRPVGHFARKFADENLLPDAERVLKKLTTSDAEVQSTTGGHWYLRRMVPYRTQDNHIAGVVITFTDITRQRLAAEAINEARLYSQAIVTTMREPFLVVGADLKVLSASSAFYRLFKTSKSETEGVKVYDLGNGQWNIPRLRELLEEVLLENQEIADFEIEHDFRDLGVRSMVVDARKMRSGHGRDAMILLSIEDVTERKRADEHRQILVGELNHRVKNTLAVVQSIASQTLSHATSMTQAREVFGARLINLAKAHDLLTRENWASAELGEIVAETVKPHASQQDRFTIEGPHLRLAPSAALAIQMALHELATNAIKYGALSSDDGHIDIIWHLKDNGGGRRLSMVWTESDGPPVVAPTRKGFGSRLIERALAVELGGEVRVAYEPSGVVCTIDAPMLDIPETLRNPRDNSPFDAGSDR